MSKVIFITGSTDGIGKLTAIQLAKLGHKIYLHGRSAEKLNSVIDEVKQASDNKHISGYVSDFSDFDAVRKMAEKMKLELAHIDILINNAGIFKSKHPITKDGLDIRFAVNYIAPVILTDLLISLLTKSNEPSVINLSSAAQSTVSIDALAGKEQLSDQSAYAQSKLAILMWSFYLSNQEPSIRVLAVNPGSLLNTKMVKEAYGKSWASPDKGADILVELSFAETHQNVTGKYFDNDSGGYNQAHADAYNEEAIIELIKHTNDLISNF